MLGVAIALLALPSSVWAQKPSLQALFDAPATRASGDVIVVDLSEWQTEYDEGLTIANGRRYRFTNGTLSRTTKLTDGPLIHISQGSEVEVATGATISGGNFYTTYPVAIVQVDDGSLLVTGGEISGNHNSSGQHGVGVNLYGQTGGRFHITAGNIADIVSNQVANNDNTLIVDGGKLSWVATCNGLQLNGNASLSTVSMAQTNDAIRLTSALTHTLRVQLASGIAVEGCCIMRGEAGYQLSQFDVNKLELTGQGDLVAKLEGNAVYLRTAGRKAGDSFKVMTEEGIEMLFVVISEEEKTCQVGTGSTACVDTNVSGTVTIPAEADGYRVIAIANRAFKECSMMTHINIPQTVTSIGTTVFESAMGAFHNCTHLLDVQLPERLTLIGRGTFGMCKSLTEVTIPESVTVIGSNAFDGCASLVSINLPQGLTELQLETFRYCSSLTSIEIPANVSSMGRNVFQGCTALETVTSHIVTPFAIDATVFARYDATLYVPVGTKAAYKATSCWNQFRTILNIGEEPARPFDLQAAIDSIAASPNPGTEAAPVELALPGEEVLITKQIKVWNTYVHLTGGRLKLDEAFAASNDSVVFLVGGSRENTPESLYGPAGGLTLSDIQFDLNNIAPRHAVFCNWDTLSIAQNVSYENVNNTTGTTGGFYVNQQARISIASGEVRMYGTALHNGGTAHISGGYLSGHVAVSAFVGDSRYIMMTGAWATHVYATGGTFYGQDYAFGLLGGGHAHTTINITGGTIDAATLTSKGAGSVNVTSDRLDIKQLNNITDYFGPMILVDGVRYFISGGIPLNMYFNYPVSATSALTADWTLFWDVPSMDFQTKDVWRLISSSDDYQLQPSDFEKVKFMGVPDSVTIYFDENLHAISAKKHTNKQSLQDLFDQQDPDDDSTEEDPTQLNPGDVDIDEGDVDVKPDLHLLFDGAYDNGTETGGRHSWDFSGGNLNIRPGASVEFRNIDFRGHDSTHYIYVEGTLIIDVNVYITGFQRFIYVREGGRVIWRGGTASVGEAGIWNEGGTVEVRGGTISSNTGRGYVNMRGTIYFYGGLLSGSLCAGHNMPEGIVYLYGGTAIGGLHNHGEMHLSGTTVTGAVSPGDSYEGLYTIVNYIDGRLTIDAGTVLGEDGNGSIWSETDFTLGDVRVSDIHIAHTVHIYVTAMWKNVIRIHFFVDGNFLADHLLFVGANGFSLPADFLEWIDIQLSEQWRLVCDETRNAIVIVSADAIESISNDGHNALTDVYAADGTLVCTGSAETARTYVTTHKGAFILRQGQKRWKVSR